MALKKVSNMLGKLQGAASGIFSKATNTALQFKNKSFMRACVSGAFLIASADGTISKQEKDKMLSFFKTSKHLQVFDVSNIIDEFNELGKVFDFDVDAGIAKAFENIAAVKGNDEQKSFIMRMLVSIAKSDSGIDNDEQKMLERICKEIGSELNCYL